MTARAFLRSLHNASNSSVNSSEIAHFSRLSSLWWDEQGEFALLHKMNPIRMHFIRQKVGECESDSERIERPLEGKDVLDVGCGGGLLSESLTRLGARTLAIDASQSNIAVASLHASLDPQLSSSPPASSRKGGLTYSHTTAETLLASSKRYDIVCSMEVLEHVDNPASFLRTCAELVKPGGHLFLSTIARTPISYVLTILLAETILRKVTPGTHTHSKYVNPSELIDFFAKYRSVSLSSPAPPPWISRTYDGVPSRTEAEVRGMAYIPWKAQWVLVPRGRSFGGWGEACNYLFWVRKPL